MTLKLDYREALTQIAASKEPDAALLYAFLASCPEPVTLTQAQEALDLPPARMERARDMLYLYGIARDCGTVPVREREPLDPKELARARQEDRAFFSLCRYYEQMLGNVLKRVELETLYHIYTELNMPADVLMLLINYCKSSGSLSARAVQREAYRWFDAGVLTYERAGNHIRYLKERRQWPSQVMKAFGIYDRKPSATEEKYIQGWLDQKVSLELLSAAYDKTVLNTGKLSWAYLNKVISNWLEQGVKTPEQVELLDAAPKALQNDGVESNVMRLFEQKQKARDALVEERLAALRKNPSFNELEGRMKRLSIEAAKSAVKGKKDDVLKIKEEHSALLLKRGELLAALGHEEDYLSPPFDCAKCNDTGMQNGRFCTCFLEECAKLRKKG